MAPLEPHAEAEEAERQDAKHDGQRNRHGVRARRDVVDAVSGGATPAVVAAIVVEIVGRPVGGDELEPRPRDAVPPRGDVGLGRLGEEDARLRGYGTRGEVAGEHVPREAADARGDEGRGEAVRAEGRAACCGEVEVGLDEDHGCLG